MPPQMPVETGRIAWHLITAGLHTGMLTLSFASMLIRLTGVWFQTGHAVWRGLVRLAEPTAHLAAIGGLLALIASAVTGLMFTWPLEVQLTSSVVLNKMAITAFSTTFWALFVVMRAIYGARLWGQARRRWVYAVMAAGGFLTLMLAGSTGGHLAGKRSMLDGILHALGINTHLLLVISRTGAAAALLVMAVLLVIAAARRLSWRRTSRDRAALQALPGP